MRFRVLRCVLGVAAIAACLLVVGTPVASATGTAPGVSTGEATGVSAAGATLTGSVSPEGEGVTECFFEYGETEAYGNTAPCVEPSASEIVGSEPVVQVHASIAGLGFATAYHFRLVAANTISPAMGADGVFTTLAIAPAVDRTSVVDVTSSTARLQAQIDPGGAFAVYHFEYLSEAQYNANGDSFSGVQPAIRVPASDAGIYAARSDQGVSQAIGGLTPDTAYYYRAVASNSIAPGGVDGAMRMLVTHSTTVEAGLPDHRVYELVSPGQKTRGTGGNVQGVITSIPTSGFVGFEIQRNIEVTEDGSEVVYAGEGFFDQTKYPEEVPVLYTSVRGSGGWSTRNISGESPEEAFAPLPRPSVPSLPVLPGSIPAAGAQVLEGTPDGSAIFFTDEERLTGDSTAAAGEPDLYRYDVPGGQVTDLTVDANAGEHADVLGILGSGGPAGEEGSYVYLVATGDLTGPQANGRNETAQAGKPNLYLSHGGTVTFIATLSAGDEQHIQESDAREMRDWYPEPGLRTAEVSPDGRYVAFGSVEELTGQSTVNEPFFERKMSSAVPEVFRYDADARSLVCASCNPDGSATAAAFLTYSVLVDRERTIEGAAPLEHYMEDDGKLFFDAMGLLGPEGIQGNVGVYEFEDAGTGTCQTAGGCRSLISGGGNSFLAAVSGEGNDVFFTTTDQLVPEDRDGSIDLYDARVDGRAPGEQPAVVCETGEACHEPVPQPVGEQVGGSTVFNGPGNLTPGAPTVVVSPKTKTGVKAMTRPQKLAKALRVCKREPRRRRASCKRAAHRRYGSKASVKRSSGRSK